MPQQSDIQPLLVGLAGARLPLTPGLKGLAGARLPLPTPNSDRIVQNCLVIVGCHSQELHVWITRQIFRVIPLCGTFHVFRPGQVMAWRVTPSWVSLRLIARSAA